MDSPHRWYQNPWGVPHEMPVTAIEQWTSGDRIISKTPTMSNVSNQTDLSPITDWICRHWTWRSATLPDSHTLIDKHGNPPNQSWKCQPGDLRSIWINEICQDHLSIDLWRWALSNLSRSSAIQQQYSRPRHYATTMTRKWTSLVICSAILTRLETVTAR